ncbi:MAG: hypothetical protein IJP15_06170 [Oscillospiraceae bacterium]|nr:hypothetical protein [Oscillospiraceae bacterium]
MKKIWKPITIVLVAMLFALPVFAGGDNANLPDDYEENPILSIEDEVQPLGADCAVCADCGLCTMAQTYYDATDWAIYAYDWCTCEGGYQPMRDAFVEQYVTITHTCTHCGISATTTNRYTDRQHFG